LVWSGIDLDAYTTLTAGADVADLRRTLGYKAVNLFGDSYGSRLALTVMRSFPTGVRSAVLDGPFPPTANLFSGRLPSARRAFDLLFRNCAHSRCNRQYPHLEQEFYDEVARLDARPVTIVARSPVNGKRYRVLLDGSSFLGTHVGFLGLLFYAMYDASLIPLLPKMISDAYDRQYHLVSQIYRSVGFGFKNTSWGVYYATLCSEDAPYINRNAMEAGIRALPRPLQANLRTEAYGRLDVCKAMRVKSVDPQQREAVSSALPTLILQGEYDPITPPSNGLSAAEHLSHSYTLLFPGVGHGARYTGSCPNSIVLAFLDDPERKPDIGCIVGMHDPLSSRPSS
jgi:pimeloyl-ACP methyl ester carboxylesterase